MHYCPNLGYPHPWKEVWGGIDTSRSVYEDDCSDDDDDLTERQLGRSSPTERASHPPPTSKLSLLTAQCQWHHQLHRYHHPLHHYDQHHCHNRCHYNQLSVTSFNGKTSSGR